METHVVSTVSLVLSVIKRLSMLALVGLPWVAGGCKTTRLADPGLPRVPEWLREMSVTPDSIQSMDQPTDEQILFPPGRWQFPDQPTDEVLALGRELGPAGLPELLVPIDRREGFNSKVHPEPSRDLDISEEYGTDEKGTSKRLSLSPLEKHYGGDIAIDVDRELVQFGYDMFGKASAAGLESTPVSAEYVLGPGDEIHIHLWGATEEHHRVKISDEGKVQLPQVGALHLAGVSYGDLPSFLRSAYGRLNHNFDLDVSLGKLRTIRVFVVGEVENPGLLEVSARSTVLTAIAVAKGLKKSGSLRSIEVRSGNRDVSRVDLYDFLLRGDRSSDRPLLEGDTVFVPVIGETIGICGYVTRPGIYEILEPISMHAALELCGGMTPFGYRETVQLERSSATGERILRDLFLEREGASVLLRDGDMAKVSGVDHVVDNAVELTGNVVRPGRFQWRSGLRVVDLLAQGGGFLTDTYFDRATISRLLGRTSRFQIGAADQKMETSHQILHLDLREAIGDPTGPENMFLLPLDTLTIHSQVEVWGHPVVRLSGAVKEPGEYELTSGMRVTDAIRIAGGVTKDAFLDAAEVVRRVYDQGGSRFDVRHLRFDLNEAFSLPERDPIIENFDEIIVRSSVEAQIRVRITGEVRFPGEYVLPRGSRVSDLLRVCGGLTENSDLRAAVFQREEVKRLQQRRLDDLVRRSVREFERAFEWIAMVGRPNEADSGAIALDQDTAWVRKLRDLQATGRVIIDFCREDFPSSSHNLILESEDKLSIPRRSYTVSVQGEVFNPSALVWAKGHSIAHYLELIGGATPDADRERAYLIRADGTVISSLQIGFDDLIDIDALPGDTILLPEAPAERPFSASVKDMSEIAVSIALASQLFSGR